MSVSYFDGVLTYHTNIHTCGVARFNHLLAKHLKVPISGIMEPVLGSLKRPVISVKFAEILESHRNDIFTVIANLGRFSAILHDFEESNLASLIIKRADRIMGLNGEIANQIRQLRDDVVTGFTVASYEAPFEQAKTDILLVTFGMAHKIQSSGYRKVAELLKRDSRTHLLEISSALHEGTEFSDAFFEVGDEISRCFEGRVRFLGFLADSEVALRVSRASALLAFFPRGARENNNSVMSAMRLSVPVITNLDASSPTWLRHEETVFDINKMAIFPPNEQLRTVGASAKSATKYLTYELLLGLLTGDDRPRGI